MTQNPLVNISDLMAQSGVAFGTSGARGPVVAMTDAVCFAYAAGFLQHMASLGEFSPGTQVALAGDLRPSTPRIQAACAPAIDAQGGNANDRNLEGHVKASSHHCPLPLAN